MSLNIITIILPNYNSEKYLDDTLKSIISQSYKDWNLKIVDDNSNIKTLNILKRYENEKNFEITYLKNNMGAGYCRNLAIKNTNSKYIAFIDSDDIWEKNKLLNQLNFMEKNNFQFTYTSYRTFNEINGKENFINPPKLFNYKKFIKNTSIATSTMMILRESINDIRFSDTKICEDYFFKCALLKKIGSANLLDQILTRYRIRKDSLQSNKFRNLYWIWKINKEMNNLNFFENFISLLMISINSIKKYGYK